MSGMAESMSIAANGGGPVGSLNTEGSAALATLKILKGKTGPLQSKKVFTEYPPLAPRPCPRPPRQDACIPRLHKYHNQNSYDP